MTVIIGSNESNTLLGSDYADKIYGYGGHDWLFGNAGADELWGGSGNDVLIGGLGADQLQGGTGNDSAWYTASTEGVYVELFNASLGHGKGMFGDAAGDTLFSVENLVGSKYADTLIGSNGANSLSGGVGDDSLLGLKGKDKLYGQDGNDQLVGGAGADRLDGGSGNDTVEYSGSKAGVFVSLIDGQTGTGGEAEGDRFYSVENASGSAHDDILMGNAVANQLYGNEGDDYLAGRGGADVIVGGEGVDRMNGGSGADRFVYSYDPTDQTGVGQGNRDVIEDFTRTTYKTGGGFPLPVFGDKIDLSAVDANPFANGNQAFVFTSQAGISGPGMVRYMHDGSGHTIVQGTLTGDGVQFEIELNGVHNLTASDFVL